MCEFDIVERGIFYRIFAPIHAHHPSSANHFISEIIFSEIALFKVLHPLISPRSSSTFCYLWFIATHRKTKIRNRPNEMHAFDTRNNKLKAFRKTLYRLWLFHRSPLEFHIIVIQSMFFSRKNMAIVMICSFDVFYCSKCIHDDVIKWKHFPRNWPFVRGIHRSRWISHTKASDVELWCFLWSAVWINGWVNNREAGDLRRHRGHYDVNVMFHFLCNVIIYIYIYKTVGGCESKASSLQYESILYNMQNVHYCDENIGNLIINLWHMARLNIHGGPLHVCP